MKAPDKIYIGDKQTQPNGFCGLAWNNPTDIIEPMEYIRKDALLAWAKEQVKKYLKMHDKTNDDADFGSASAYEEVIDKLNEL